MVTLDSFKEYCIEHEAEVSYEMHGKDVNELTPKEYQKVIAKMEEDYNDCGV